MFRTGVAFSGGGIRSAALCSGVLRRLLQRGVEPDYLSCVSGGGYTGTAYLDWKYRNKGKDDPSWHKRFFAHMRSRTGLLCDWKKPLHGILDTAVILVLMLFVSVITPLVVWGSYACPLAFVIDFLFGKFLQANKCELLEKNIQNSTGTSRTNCTIQKGTLAYSRVVLFAVSLFLFLFLYYVWKKVPAKFAGITYLLSTCCGLLFASTFGPWFIHDFLNKTPRVLQVSVVFISIIMWFFAPVLRRSASFVLVVYSFTYVIYWRVYKEAIGGIKYTEPSFQTLLLISALVMWFVPLLGAFQTRLVHIYNRWRLQIAFYTEKSVGTCGCAGISCQDYFPGSHFCTNAEGEHEPLLQNHEASLSLADLQNMKPQYISNIVVNEWRVNPQDKTEYHLLTMSPTKIERIDRQPKEKEFSGLLAPRDIKLSDAMATSAAAVSRHMGAYEESTESFKHIQTILGLGMGASMVSDVAFEKREGCFLKVLSYVLGVVRVAPLVAIPVTYFSESGDEMLIAIGLLVFFAFHFLLTAAVVVTTGQEKITRWLLVHVPFCRYIRDLLNINTRGPVPPAILRLSDGGHIENLAILPLLKRRLQRIVVVNGGYSDPDSSYGNDLVHALELARKKLNCYFLGIDGRDVIQDIRDKFVKRTTGKQPRSYKFRVDYYDKESEAGEVKKVGEGEVILIAPRHPNKGVQTNEHVTWKEALRDINVDLEADLWGPGPDLEAAEVDRLTFCCCECCHDKMFCGISKFLCGVFPHHVTANQFFTPTMFSVYHREGYRACVEANAAEFLGAAPSIEMRIVVEP